MHWCSNFQKQNDWKTKLTCFFSSSASPDVAARASLEAAADHGWTISSTAPDNTCTLEAHSRPIVCRRSTTTRSRGLVWNSCAACTISGVSFSISSQETRTSLRQEICIELKDVNLGRTHEKVTTKIKRKRTVGVHKQQRHDVYM